MKNLLTIYLTISTIVYAHGQEGSKQDVFKSFSIIIIKPDNAQIADSLNVYAKSIEDKQSAMYLSVIKFHESRRKNVDDEEKKRIDAEIENAKQRAENDRDFRFFHSIASKTLRELGSLFNSNEIDSD